MSNRLLFKKEGRAKYISHLDLMRTMQRVFIRADVAIRHTEGFNPHPYMSFALPLSVGCESVCELMDFDYIGNGDITGIPEKLNAVMPEGMTALKVYETSRKIKELIWLEVEGVLTYDSGVSEETATRINAFFKSESIVILKKSKKGMTETDVIPLINAIKVEKQSGNTLYLRAVIAAQNPSLNPELLVSALRQKLPEYAPDFAQFKRLEVFDADFNIFR